MKTEKKFNWETRHAPEAKKQIDDLIREGIEAGMKAKEMLAVLIAHGCKKADGSELDYNWVNGVLYKARKDVKPKAKEAPKPDQPKAKPAPIQNGEIKLMSRVLDLKISPERTIQFLNFVRDGEIDFAKALWILDTLEELKGKS